MAGEVRKTGRDWRYAALTSVCLCTALYMLVAGAYVKIPSETTRNVGLKPNSTKYSITQSLPAKTANTMSQPSTGQK